MKAKVLYYLNEDDLSIDKHYGFLEIVDEEDKPDYGMFYSWIKDNESDDHRHKWSCCISDLPVDNIVINEDYFPIILMDEENDWLAKRLFKKHLEDKASMLKHEYTMAVKSLEKVETMRVRDK